MNAVISKIEPELLIKTKKELQWRTVLFDCNCHLLESVVDLLVKAINCSIDKAYLFARTAESLGSVAVFYGSKSQCENAMKWLTKHGMIAATKTTPGLSEPFTNKSKVPEVTLLPDDVTWSVKIALVAPTANVATIKIIAKLFAIFIILSS